MTIGFNHPFYAQIFPQLQTHFPAAKYIHENRNSQTKLFYNNNKRFFDNAHIPQGGSRRSDVQWYKLTLQHCLSLSIEIYTNKIFFNEYLIALSLYTSSHAYYMWPAKLILCL